MTTSFGQQGVRFTKIGFFSGVSVAALLLGSNEAAAQCAPDPTVESGTTTCTGDDADGLRVTTRGTTVQVPAGSIVSGTARPAIVIDIPVNPSDPSSQVNVATISVAGRLTGTGQSGIVALNGSTVSSPFWETTRLNLTVAAGGEVAGTTALSLALSVGNTTSRALAVIDNAGTLSGTSGVALQANNPSLTGFLSITNRSGGTIGAISGPVGTLTNAGTIDGGSRSAVDYGTTFNGFVTSGAWTNTGVIRSASNNGTLATTSQASPVVNSGSIVNSGQGLAIQGGTVLTVSNLASGTISAAGGTAIFANALTLTNRGTITGNVIALPQQGFGFTSTIDSSQGTINGNVVLGQNNDVVVARYVGGPTLVTGVLGQLNAGGGTNTIRLDFDRDAAIDTAIALPTTFQRLALTVVEGATITLANGFVAPSVIALSGAGSVINRATITNLSQVFTSGVANFTNEGVIRTSPSGTFLNAITASSFTNNGVVDVAGPGVVATQLTNNGSIVATGRAVNIFQGSLTNTGLIRSTGGIGLDASANVGVVYTNTGRIEGATFGAAISGATLVNSGTIQSATGTAFGLGHYGVLVNEVGGVVDGGIRPYGGGGGNMLVVNRGTVIGNVDIGANFANSGNTFVAGSGSIVRGDLQVGTGLFVTDLVNTGPGAFAGVTGSVISQGGSLRYRVNGTTAATVGPVGPFQTVGFELVEGAALSLTGSSTRTLTLAGTGTVDLDAVITSTAQVLATTINRIPGIDTSVSAITITNRGTLTYSRESDSSNLAGVFLARFFDAPPSQDRLINDGTIAVADRTTRLTPSAIAVAGGVEVMNKGSILVENAIGIDGTTSVVNTGSIRQTGGTVASIGLRDVQTIDNRGTIQVAGNGVSGTGTLTNSGAITSTAGIAIDRARTIDNLAGGIITGATGFAAIRGYGSSIVNAGSIVGDIDLSDGFFFTSGTSTYTAAGGTVAGRVLFGSADGDRYVQTGATSGVSGTIDGGAGDDSVILNRAQGGSFAGAVNFENLAVDAGTWTITGPAIFANGTTIASGAGLVGTSATLSGAIANAGTLTFDQSATGAFTGAITGAGALTKMGTGTLTLGAQAYTGATNVNAGTLALTGNLAGGTYAVASGATLTSALSATISATATPVSIANSGTISTTNATGRAINLAGAANARDITLTNNVGGLITSADDAFRINFNPTGGTITVNNFGVIRTTTAGQALDFDAVAGGATIVINNAAGAELRSIGQDAIRPGQGATVTNAGLIISDGAPNNSFDGIDWQARSGAVNNQGGGTISGLRHGITGDAAVTVTNAGTILGRNGSGIGSDGTGTVINTGTITGQWDGVSPNGDGDGVDIDLVGSVTNSGTIQGIGAAGADAAGRANSAEGVAMGGGTIVNNAGATIFGAGNAILINHDTNPGGAADAATTITNAGTIHATTGRAIQLIGAFADTLTNSGTITGGAAGAIDMGDGANRITNAAGGTINGNVVAGSGDDIFTNAGVMNGNVDLGNGNNTFLVQAGGTFAGTLTAGNGTADQILLQTTGTYQAPGQVNGAIFNGFEILQNTGGTNRLTGSFAGGVNVTGGYLFGALGSTITGNVNVGTGAQFGTSGVVNGNVAVGAGGILAPGSSPGVMTVNGNVALAAGSSSIFEFVPAPGQSDQLLISGSLTIGANTTLNMTGTRPLTPGVNYDLIVANGGISGTFATVNQPATVAGFLRYAPNRLQLMGTFLTPAGVTAQQASAIGYVNTVLISGQASAPLLAAVPSLLRADGAANPAAFNLLTAEAYASASQLGVENALSLAQAGRSGIVRTTRDEAGLFVFAQGMGDRRTLKAKAAIGTSRARSESWGVLGGIGYGVDGASIGAFIGHTDSRQRIAALGAATDADGIVAGLAGHFAIEGFEFGLLGAYDWTKADTGRSVPGGRVDSSQYRLGSLLIDASVGANIPLGTDWAVRPEAGITHVRGHRGAAREIGSTAFALDLDRDRFSATFVDTSIALKGGLGEGAAFHPWLQAGIRRQIAGGTETASAGFVGGASRFTSFGAGRKEKVITAGAGASYDIGGVTLFAAYQGEFGGGNGHNGNVGVRFGF